MPLKPESRAWFEKAIFDLAIAQAHMQSHLWTDAGQFARQAAQKFLQAGLVAYGEPEPSPRLGQLGAALAQRAGGFQAQPEWAELDRFASPESVGETEGRRAFAQAEQIRDAIAALLSR